MNKKNLKTIIIAVPILVIAIGLKLLQGDGRLLYMSSDRPAAMQARFYRFSDEKERKVGLSPGDELIIRWEETEKAGSLRLEISDPEGKLIKRIDKGPAEYRCIAAQKGNYRLMAVGEKARGSFSVSWDYIQALDR
ncbi:hypothetical protein [Sediminispirochaeta bajacaliforniensis]|uniref:hypothetical protein n=1 Tax=Sediminispirochaeta bajacaliforniensis TaxID=148 RepID=UPI000377FD51|nr:hypothetical protein [Sediminispirochaeta bajacaliforniensis]